jgi:hypothetical protein
MRRLVLLAALVFSSLPVFGLMPGTGLAASTVLVGNSSVASVADDDATGLAEAFRFATTASGSANSASVYVDSGSRATGVVVGIYANNGGQPGSLLATGAKSGPAAGQWNQVTFGSDPNDLQRYDVLARGARNGRSAELP